jgi:hypothetical protein
VGLGYKLHITETCDDAPPCSCRPAAAAQPPAGEGGHGREHDKTCASLVFPNLITQAATTDATVTDNQMTGVIHDDLAAKNLAPGRHYVDSGYLSAAAVVSALATRGIALIGPLLADTSAQARAGAGYARADFTADYDPTTVTCPQGKTSASWTPCAQDAVRPARQGRDRGHLLRRRLRSLPGPRPVRHRQAAAAHRAAPGPGPSPGRRPDRSNRDRLPGRLRPPRRRRGHHAPGRQPRRAAWCMVPRPAQDPP